MTEEIIIDGVDVAGCEHHLSTGYCELQMIFQGMVLKLPFGKHLECNLCDKDCYYKQLKRLEQENKKLKKDVQLFKCLDTFGESECHCACRCLGNEFCEDADKKINNYRSALEEILESAKFAQCLPCGSGNLEDCLNCDDDTTNNGQFCMEKRIHEIKTKCVEVLK